MAKIDWDFARTADWWTLEQFCEFVCPDDPSARAKLDRLARLAIQARTLVPKGFVSGRPRFHPGIYGEPPPRRPDIFYLAPAEALAWARSKGFTIPPELAGIESPRPASMPQVAAQKSDLTPLKQQNETPAERYARIAARHEELKAGGKPTKTLAEEQGKSESWIRQMIAKARKSR